MRNFLKKNKETLLHPFHLVRSSLWSMTISFSAFFFVFGLVKWMHKGISDESMLNLLEINYVYLIFIVFLILLLLNYPELLKCDEELAILKVHGWTFLKKKPTARFWVDFFFFMLLMYFLKIFYLTILSYFFTIFWVVTYWFWIYFMYSCQKTQIVHFKNFDFVISFIVESCSPMFFSVRQNQYIFPKSFLWYYVDYQRYFSAIHNFFIFGFLVYPLIFTLRVNYLLAKMIFSKGKNEKMDKKKIYETLSSIGFRLLFRVVTFTPVFFLKIVLKWAAGVVNPNYKLRIYSLESFCLLENAIGDVRYLLFKEFFPLKIKFDLKNNQISFNPRNSLESLGIFIKRVDSIKRMNFDNVMVHLRGGKAPVYHPVGIESDWVNQKKGLMLTSHTTSKPPFNKEFIETPNFSLQGKPLFINPITKEFYLEKQESNLIVPNTNFEMIKHLESQRCELAYTLFMSNPNLFANNDELVIANFEKHREFIIDPSNYNYLDLYDPKTISLAEFKAALEEYDINIHNAQDYDKLHEKIMRK